MTDLHVPFAEIRTPEPSSGEDPLELLARMVEAEVHPGGWDQQAIFGMLWSHPDRSIIWRTQPTPAPFLDRPDLGLVTMANIMEESASLAAAAAVITPNFWGWAAVFEAWELNPGFIEIRSFYAATIDGRLVALCRQRGCAPEWLGAIKHQGAVPDAMRRLAETGRAALAARGWRP